MKNILVPTDFSEEATAALDAAYAIASRSGGTINLLHVIDAPYGFDGGMPAPGDAYPTTSSEEVYVLHLMEQAKEQMLELVESERYADVTINHDVVVERVSKHIEDYAAEHNIDLIAMGTTGADGIDELLIGSNTERVVRRAACPVLAVKEGSTFDGISDIVLATDGSDDIGPFVEQLKAFQEMFGAKIHLLTVNTVSRFRDNRALKAALETFVHQYELTNYTVNIYNDASEEDGIIYFADEINADLIALATHGRTGLSHLFRGSIAEDLVNHDKRPVLTYNLRRIKR